MKGKISFAFVVFAVAFVCPLLTAQSDREPKVPIAWNRFYDYDGIVKLCAKLAAAYPQRCTLSYLGPSEQQRPMPLLTIASNVRGDLDSRSAMWVDGNVHGNEVQGAEACVYLAWTLLERYGEVDAITEVVDERVFYILPMVNPDGRQYWFEEANTAHSSRSGQKPTDNDRDGLFDEDGPDDLDGDGHIVAMRKRVEAGTGTHRLSPDDRRLLEFVPMDKRVEWGADYVLLGEEGFDNDNDGRVNEDGAGGYDMNRNWPADWMPGYIQYGAGEYPFSYSETKAIGQFLLAKTHVAAVQSFHNAGGMILRGPGAPERKGYYGSADRRVYDAIAEEGEKQLPFYRKMIIHEDLYTVHGGFVNWTAEGLGVISFTNELWNSAQAFAEGTDGEWSFDEGTSSSEKRLVFDDLLLFGETYVDWHEAEHPDYGAIEVGGFKKMTGRTPPTFMIEEMLHRNAAFCVYHASQLPKIEVVSMDIDSGPGEARVVTVEFRNTRWIPTRTAVAAEKGIGIPDRVTLEGEDVVVLAGGTGADRFDLTQFDAVEDEPARLLLQRGIPGHGSERVRWLVRGSGSFRVTLVTEKAGTTTVEGSL